MEGKGYSDIRALNDLENGIHSFGRQMAESNSEIEHTIDLYFQDFERGLQILEERLRKALEDVERAEIALERKRNEQVWVEDEDGEGHWEQADCSAEEVAVARCHVKRERCKRDVNECRQMIADARTKRYIIAEKFSIVENNSRMALEKLRQIKDVVERHRSIQVPSAFSSTASSHSFPTSRPTTPSSSSSLPSTPAPKGHDMQRPRPPMNTNLSYSPKPNISTERPRSPISESVHPTPQKSVTEADRPRSPYGNGERVTKLGVDSFREGLKKLQDKYKDEDTDG